MFQQRDSSGPMDVDPGHPLGSAAVYALDDGPARKRPHSCLSPAPFDPFAAQEQASSYKFGPNTPFLFHAPPLPPAPKFEQYEPSRWARTDFGFGPGAGSVPAGGSFDVEMDGRVPEDADNPATPTSKAEVEPKAETPKTPPVRAASLEDSTPPRKIAQGAVARVRRKRRQWTRQVSDDEDDEEGDSRVMRSGRKHTYNLHMSQGTRHHEVPAILLGYVQFVFNASLVIGFLYIAVQFILAVRRDVQERIEEYSVEILQEIGGCTQAYLTNRCEPNLRVPAMEAACVGWELCMNRDPKVVGRARVGAETFADVINSFVDPISWKTMGFTLVTLTFLIVLANSALFNLRAKHQTQVLAQQHQQQQQYQHQYPPWMGPGMGHEHGIGMPQPAPPVQQGMASKAMGWLKK